MLGHTFKPNIWSSRVTHNGQFTISTFLIYPHYNIPDSRHASVLGKEGAHTSCFETIILYARIAAPQIQGLVNFCHTLQTVHAFNPSFPRSEYLMDPYTACVTESKKN